MQFISGMYWCARSPETERIRMRDCSIGRRIGSRPSLPPGLMGFTEEEDGPVALVLEARRVCLCV